MKKLLLFVAAFILGAACVACASKKTTDYTSYEGKTYEGESPWGGKVSVSIDKISDGNMEWSYLEEVSSGWGYNIQMTCQMENGKGDFTIEADNDTDKAEYSGSIELKDGTVVLTYEDGQKTEYADSEDGGSGYEMAGALEDDQKAIILEEVK